MPKTIKEERVRWILPIINKEMRLVDVARICPHSKRSLERWCRAYKTGGEDALVPKTTTPKTSPNETPIRAKEAVIQKRRETKLCAQKIHWRLKKEGLSLPVRTIGKIIKDEGLVRKYRTKKIVYKYIKATRQPGDLVEIDVKFVPGKIADKRYFQYTAIDVASRWRYLRIFEEQSNYHSVLFLNDVIARFEHKIKSIKTDNGFVFTNRYTGAYKRSDLSSRNLHAFDQVCGMYNIIHYLIDPGKPAQNGTVERSHREDQEKFYDRNYFKSAGELQRSIRIWNTYYNNLEHCGLNGLSPNEFLRNYQLINPPNVLA